VKAYGKMRIGVTSTSYLNSNHTLHHLIDSFSDQIHVLCSLKGPELAFTLSPTSSSLRVKTDL
jgi:hypothetical protein